MFLIDSELFAEHYGTNRPEDPWNNPSRILKKEEESLINCVRTDGKKIPQLLNSFFLKIPLWSQRKVCHRVRTVCTNHSENSRKKWRIFDKLHQRTDGKKIPQLLNSLEKKSPLGSQWSVWFFFRFSECCRVYLFEKSLAIDNEQYRRQEVLEDSKLLQLLQLFQNHLEYSFLFQTKKMIIDNSLRSTIDVKEILSSGILCSA